MSHFLFVAGAFPARSSLSSAETQLTHGIWGIRTPAMRDILHQYATAESRGLVYVLKSGILAGFKIDSGVLPPESLDALVRDELRDETKFGFVRITPLQTWPPFSEKSQAVLQELWQLRDRQELLHRLDHLIDRLTPEQYDTIIKALGSSEQP